jgi:hypothetical protein
MRFESWVFDRAPLWLMQIPQRFGNTRPTSGGQSLCRPEWSRRARGAIPCGGPGGDARAALPQFGRC